VELFSIWTANVVLTSIFVCTILACLACLPALVRRVKQPNWPIFFFAIFSFSMLGFVTGLIMVDSRSAAVGTVVPAVLALFGGFAIYVVGVKGTKAQSGVSAMVFCFAFSLLIGSVFGAQLRVAYEQALDDPERARQRELGLEQVRHAVELQHLQNYVELLQIKQGLADKFKLDLSKFVGAMEKKPSESGAKKPDKAE
jgi:hypothetical protein